MAPITSAIDAYLNFDARKVGWVKTELLPAEQRADGQRESVPAEMEH